MRILVFKPRAPIVLGSPQTSQAGVIPAPTAVIAAPKSPMDYGLGRGSAFGSPARLIPIPSLIVPAPRPQIAQQAAPPQLPPGNVLFLRSPFQSQMPVTPPARVVLVQREHNALNGAAISAHANPSSVTPLALRRPAVVVQTEERGPHNGFVVFGRGGVDSGTLVTRKLPIVVLQSEWRPYEGSVLIGLHAAGLADPTNKPVLVRSEERVPHTGDVLVLRGGAVSGSLVARAIPVIISQQESASPYPGSVASKIGGVSSGTTVTPARPTLVARIDTLPPYAGSVTTYALGAHDAVGPTAPRLIVRSEERTPHVGDVLWRRGGVATIAPVSVPFRPIVIRPEEHRPHSGNVWYRHAWPSLLPPIIDYYVDVWQQVDFAFDVSQQIDYSCDIDQQVDFSFDVNGPP